MLESIDLPHPKSYVFSTIDDLDKEIFDSGLTFVCKPEVGTNGRGVTFDIQSIQDVQHYLAQNPKIYSRHLLKEFVKGKDLRLQIIGGHIVAACIRKPASVIGNGETTLHDLIGASQKKVKAQNPSNDLVIDSEMLKLLEAQKISLEDIPQKGKSIQLRRIANMGQGAMAIDCTYNFDSILQTWVRKISSFLDCSYFAVDIISEDISSVDKCKILEINAKVEWLHHTFSLNKQHDLAAIIIKELLSEVVP